MDPLDYAVTAAGAAVIVVVANAIYQAISGKAGTAGDEGPIRVKGGSVYVDAPDDWEDSSGEYKLKNNDNPKLRFWSGRVFVDGVPSNQWNGRVVEVDITPNAGGQTKTLKCKVRGGIRVTPASDLAIKSTDHKRLQNTDVYISAIRIRDSLAPLDFGPFTKHESETVEIVMDPQVQ